MLQITIFLTPEIPRLAHHHNCLLHHAFLDSWQQYRHHGVAGGAALAQEGGQGREGSEDDKFLCGEDSIICLEVQILVG